MKSIPDMRTKFATYVFISAHDPLVTLTKSIIIIICMVVNVLVLG